MLATIAAAVLPDLISRLASRLGDGANPGTPVTSADLTPVTDSLKRVEDKMATLEEALRDYTKRTVESQQEYDRRLKELDDKVKAVEVAQRAQKEDVDTKFATINGKIDSNQRQLDEILKKLDKLVPPAAIPSGAAAPGTAPPAGGSGEGPAASAVVRPKESGSDEVPTPKE
ncbi:MAG: hypothetical protein NT069_22765 [Planctomycetota bacterium]|nr:hypothetical protein [Planctomycetota bacterium]